MKRTDGWMPETCDLSTQERTLRLETALSPERDTLPQKTKVQLQVAGDVGVEACDG